MWNGHWSLIKDIGHSFEMVLPSSSSTKQTFQKTSRLCGWLHGETRCFEFGNYSISFRMCLCLCVWIWGCGYIKNVTNDFLVPLVDCNFLINSLPCSWCRAIIKVDGTNNFLEDYLHILFQDHFKFLFQMVNWVHTNNTTIKL